MSFKKFNIGCCCSCTPQICVNLYDGFTGTDLGDTSNLSVRLQWGTFYETVDGDGNITNWDAYQWPTGVPPVYQTYMDVNPGKGFQNPMTVSGYRNDSIITISGTLSPPKPWFSPFNTGDCLCGGYHQLFVGFPDNIHQCFGYDRTNVKMAFAATPYDNSLGPTCFPATTFCDIDVCDSGHLCANVPYCPSYVNMTFDPNFCSIFNGLTAFFAVALSKVSSIECPSGNAGILGTRDGGFCGLTPYFGCSTMTATFMFDPSYVYDSGSNRLLAADRPFYVLFPPGVMISQGPNFNTYGGGFYDPYNLDPLQIPGHAPFSAFGLGGCGEVELWFCDCIKKDISSCNQSIDFNQTCTSIGTENWFGNVQCPGTSDCCGNSVNYPGKWPVTPLQISMKFHYQWPESISYYGYRCAFCARLDCQGPITIPAGSTIITVEGEIPFTYCGNFAPQIYGPVTLPANGSFPGLSCPTVTDGVVGCGDCGINAICTECTDCTETSYSVKGCSIGAIFLPGVQGDFNCISLYAINFFWDAECTIPLSYSPPCTSCGCSTVGFTIQNDPCIFLCGGGGPIFQIYGNGTIDLCNNVLMFTSCDGGDFISVTV